MREQTTVTVDRRDFTLALTPPLRTAQGSLDRREGTLLRLVTGEGTVGLGEATPLPGWTESLTDCRSALARATDALRTSEPPSVSQGSIAEEDHPVLDAVADRPAARHAITQALLDLTARRHRIPLYRTLGAPDWVRTVPVNVTLGNGSVTETAQLAATEVRRGFRCVKIKVGARSVAEDIDRLAGVRDVVGNDVRIRADANEGWTRRQARRALSAMDDRGLELEFVEQPIVAGDLSGLADLRAHPGPPIAVDETLAETTVADVFAADAADVVVCKPMVLGGIDRAVSTARQAHTRNLSAVITTTIDGVVARTGAVHAAAGLTEPPHCGLATADRLATDLGPDPAPIRSGRATVPQYDGIGPTDWWWSS